MAIRHCFYVFICIFADVARIFVFVANVAWGMQHVHHVEYVAHEWTIEELHMQHVQHVACNIFAHIFHCCTLVQHEL